MRAPDKIYVWEHNIGAGTITDLGELCVQGSIEYIRKDALLKWAKDMKEANDGVCDTSYYQEFIDKINSM